MRDQLKFRSHFFESEKFHVYNRTNNRELLFKEDRNRIYFLDLYRRYMTPVVDTYGWTLIPNHFHFLIGVKTFDDIRYNLQQLDPKKLSATEEKFISGGMPVPTIISHRFGRFIQSYAQGINSEYERKGNLFNKTPNRLRIENDDQFMDVLMYIHSNCLKHGISRDFTTFPWSSWAELMSDKANTFVDRAEVMRVFGGREEFLSAHLRRILEKFPEIHDLEDDSHPSLKGWIPSTLPSELKFYFSPNHFLF